MAELADALDLGSSGIPCGFNSRLSHHAVYQGGCSHAAALFWFWVCRWRKACATMQHGRFGSVTFARALCTGACCGPGTSESGAKPFPTKKGLMGDTHKSLNFLEPLSRIELLTSSLPRMRSTY